MMTGFHNRQASARTKAGAKWLSKVKKGQVAPKGLHIVAHELFLIILDCKKFDSSNLVCIHFKVILAL